MEVGGIFLEFFGQKKISGRKKRKILLTSWFTHVKLQTGLKRLNQNCKECEPWKN